MTRVIESPGLPKPVGAYSIALAHKDILTVSGHIAINREGRNLCEADIGTQVRCIFENLREILRAAGTSLDHVLDVTVFLTDINEFAAFDDLYTHEFGSHRPTRSLVQVSALPKRAKVELKVVAYLDASSNADAPA